MNRAGITLANLRIQFKIMLLLALLAVVTIGLTFYAGSMLMRVDSSYSKLTDTTLPGTAKLIRANRFATAMGYAGYRAMAYDAQSPQARAAVKEAETAFEKAKRYFAEVAAAEPDQAQAIAPFQAKLDAVNEALGRSVQLSLQNRDEDARQAMVVADEQLVALSQALTSFNDTRVAQGAVLSKTLSAQSASTYRALIVIALGGIGVAMVVAFFMSRSQIAGPLAGLQDAMRALASGNLAVDVPGTSRKDEVGMMAASVLVFKEAGQAQQRAAEAKQRAEAAQKLVVETIEGHLARLADGDLTATIEAQFAAEYEGLKRNFNSAIASLQELIAAVADGAEAISTGSAEIAQASEDLARRTEGAAASLEETSAAVSQMDQRIKTTAAASTKTVERATAAIGVVDSGRSIADEAMQAMTRVSESAKGIDNVIEGLDKIAFQTRVLAMNAAVEAGRAGEAGRGFAVVADLVSALAMRAEEEAGRARDQLTATQTDIGAAVEMVRRVDGALGAIVGDVNEVHSLLETMAKDNQVQSAAVTQVATAVSSIDQTTQQNAAMVEQTSAAARNLTSEVSSLSESAARFNTGRSAARRPAARSRVHALPIPSSPAHSASVSTVRQTGAEVEEWASF
jgi:methyl-accepting chemotaxis protein